MRNPKIRKQQQKIEPKKPKVYPDVDGFIQCETLHTKEPLVTIPLTLKASKITAIFPDQYNIGFTVVNVEGMQGGWIIKENYQMFLSKYNRAIEVKD